MSEQHEPSRDNWISVWRKPRDASDMAYERVPGGDYPSLSAAVTAISGLLNDPAYRGYVYRYMPYYFYDTRCRFPLPSEDIPPEMRDLPVRTAEKRGLRKR